MNTKKFILIVVSLLFCSVLYFFSIQIGTYFHFGYEEDSIAHYMPSYDVVTEDAGYNSDFVINNDCSTKGGGAGESGYKVWCWSDMTLSKMVVNAKKPIDKRQLKIATECNSDQVKIEDGRLRFHVRPKAEILDIKCEQSYNMRAEIRTAPWKVNHAPGTEEWFGWTYTFEEDYKIDKENPWLFFQVHEGTVGDTPLIALWCMNNGGPGSGKAGEVHLVNNSYATKSFYYPTGFVPKAGETLKIVVHVIWDDFNNGLLQLWINGVKVHDKNERTVRATNLVGGNAKWGIYKWKWAEKKGVEKSIAQGIFSLNTSMGPLRIITRKPKDENYLKPSYSIVMPE